MKTKVNTEFAYIGCQVMRWIDDEKIEKELAHKIYDLFEKLPATTSYVTKEKLIKFTCECFLYGRTSN